MVIVLSDRENSIFPNSFPSSVSRSSVSVKATCIIIFYILGMSLYLVQQKSRQYDALSFVPCSFIPTFISIFIPTSSVTFCCSLIGVSCSLRYSAGLIKCVLSPAVFRRAILQRFSQRLCLSLQTGSAGFRAGYCLP